jgi:hypothetical protein
MSWDQDYSVPSVEDLLEKLTGFTGLELLEEELKCQGVLITKEETIVLDDGDFFGPVMGTKITLSDGRVFVPKLVERFTENGNHGIDTYEYVLESETPVVQHTSNDIDKEGKQDYIETTEDPSFNCGGCDKCNGCEYGLTDEYPPGSDGDIDSPIDEAME